VGAAVNRTGESVAGPFSVGVYCFGGSTLLSRTGVFANQPGPLAADGQATFSADLFGANCPQLTVGVSGFLKSSGYFSAGLVRQVARILARYSPRIASGS